MSPLEIQKTPVEKYVVADRRLFLTADRSELVEEGDRRAAFLFTSAGKRIPLDVAKQYGMLDEKAPAAPNEPEPAAPNEPEPAPEGDGEKKQDPAEDKKADAAANKARAAAKKKG